MNPSDDLPGGFSTIANGIFVPGGYFNSKGAFVNDAITANSYNIQKVLMTWWGGAKYAVRPDLDVAFGYYFQSQNNFNQPSARAPASTSAATSARAVCRASGCSSTGGR